MTRTMRNQGTRMLDGHRPTDFNHMGLLYWCLVLYLMITGAVPQVTDVMTTVIERIGPDPDFQQKNLSDIDLSVTTASVHGNTVVTQTTTIQQHMTTSQSATTTNIFNTTTSSSVAASTLLPTGTTAILTTPSSETTVTSNSANNGTINATLTTPNPAATVATTNNTTADLNNSSTTVSTTTVSMVTVTPSSENQTASPGILTTTSVWNSSVESTTISPVYNSTGNDTGINLPEPTTPGSWNGNGTMGTTTLFGGNTTGNVTLETTTPIFWNTTGNVTLETTTPLAWNTTGNVTLETTTLFAWNTTGNDTLETTTIFWNTTGNVTVETTTPLNGNTTANTTMQTTTPSWQNTTGNATTQNSTTPWTELNDTMTSTVDPVYWNMTTQSSDQLNATTVWAENRTDVTASTTPFWNTNSTNDSSQWTTSPPSQNYTTPIYDVTNANQTASPDSNETLTTTISITTMFTTTSTSLTTSFVTSSCVNNSCSNNATCQPVTSESDVITEEESTRRYICRCSERWTGSNCTIAVRSCDPACVNGLCSAPIDQTIRTTCICYRGWTGPACGDDIDECSGAGIGTVVGGASSACPAPNSVCNNTRGSYQCSCKEGFEGDGIINCTENVMYPYGDSSGLRLSGAYFASRKWHTIRVPGGFPYFGSIYRQLQIAVNGYIQPGVPKSMLQDLPVRAPASNSGQAIVGKFTPNDTKIAPYFSDIDLSAVGGDSSIFINSHVFASANEMSSSSSRDQSQVYALLMKHLGKYSNNSNFMPRFAAVVTWFGVSPYPARIYAGSEKATFQAVLTTDGNASYAVFNYPTGKMNWVSSSDNRTIVIGVSSRDRYMYGLQDQDNIYRPDLYTNTGTPGRFIFKLGDMGDLKEPNLFQPCVDWNVSQSLVSPTQGASPPLFCPCTRAQAEVDPRFINRTDDSCWIYRIALINSSAIYPVCCYNSRGAIISGVDGSHLETSDDLLSGSSDVSKGGLRKCCYDNTALCSLYYERRAVIGCSKYEPPKLALVWGDPHVSTFGEFNYSFNGQGEYYLYRSLNTSGWTVQGRLEKDSQVELNVTCLTSVALTSVLDAPNTKVELRFADGSGSSAGSVQVYVNGQALTVTSVPSVVSQGGIFIQRDGSTSVTIILRSTSTVLQVKSLNSAPISRCLRLAIAAPSTEADPLTAEGPLINPGGRGLTINQVAALSEQDLYSQLIRWKIARSSESLFSYTSLLPFDSIYQASLTFQPTYFVERLANLTYLDTIGQNVSALCSSVRFCMEDYLKSGNISLAVEINQALSQILQSRKIFSNQPPIFSDGLPTTLQLVEGERIEFMLSAVDPEKEGTIQFSVETNIPTSQFTLTPDGRFTWLPVYTQNISYSVRFSAVDSKGAAALYWPSVQLCACASEGAKDEVHNRCMWDNSQEYFSNSERFQTIPCLCRSGWSGERCSDQADVATCTLCNGGSQCLINSQATPSTDRFYCSDCLPGLIRDGNKCYDNNECLETPARCSQLCRNLAGTYACTCAEGYTLLPSSNRTCVDIDECQKQMMSERSSSAPVCGSDMSVTSSMGQYCQNTDGSYLCGCKTGFYSSGNSDSGAPFCTAAPKQYTGRLKFEGVITGATTVQPWDPLMNISGSALFEMVARNVETEVSKAFSYMNTSFVGAKVTQLSSGSIVSTFDLYFGPQTSMTVPVVSKFIVNYLDRANCQRTGASCTLGNLTFVDLNSLMIKEKDYCSNPVSNNCDPTSTECVNYNGGFLCRCRRGFQTWKDYDSVCQDINECEADPLICPQNSTCMNTPPGSYTCSCPLGYLNISSVCTELCNPNPCKNDGVCIKSTTGYECRCSGIWSGQNCTEENSEAQRLKKIAMGLGIGLGAFCLLLLTAFLVLCICYVRGRRSYDCTTPDPQPMGDGNYRNGGGANKSIPHPDVNYYEPATMQINERAGPDTAMASAPENHELSERAPMYEQSSDLYDGRLRGTENPAYSDSTAPLANPRSRNKPASSPMGVEYF